MARDYVMRYEPVHKTTAAIGKLFHALGRLLLVGVPVMAGIILISSQIALGVAAPNGNDNGSAYNEGYTCPVTVLDEDGNVIDVVPCPPGEKPQPRPTDGNVSDFGEYFPPFEDANSTETCGPENNVNFDGTHGCFRDTGVTGEFFSSEVGQQATQVGFAFGYRVAWEGNEVGGDRNQNRKHDAGDGCALVILETDSLFRRLNIEDGHVSVFTIWPGDVEGVTKALAKSLAYEQSQDYGCPEWAYDDLQRWSSGEASPPCGDPANYSNCDAGNTPVDTNPSGEEPTDVDPNGGSAQGCDEGDLGANCMTRRGSGGRTIFAIGESVYGWDIFYRGSTQPAGHDCYIEKTTKTGYVIDGVVNYQSAEVAKARRCR